MSEQSVDFLIVGGGIAGFSCARALRAAGADGSIAVVSREPVPPFDRTACTKGYLRGEAAQDDVLLAPDEWWEQHDVALFTRTSALKLDAAAQTTALSDKRVLRYGQALLATGANVRRLRVDGAQLEGIHYVRGLGNADAVRADAQDAEDVVLVGGSYIATEAAASLTVMGKRCTIVMQEGVTLERGFGPLAGSFFQRLLEEHGVDVCVSDELERFEGADGRLTHVVTARGRRIPAQLAVIGAGAVPDAMLAQRAGLEIGATGGIATDECLRAGAPGLFAAGDMCEYPSVVHGGRRLRIEHWDVAEQQGATAARGMLGEPRPHDAVPYFYSDLADWASLEYVGPARRWDEEVVRGSVDEGAFTVLYLDAGRVVAGLTVGRGHEVDAMRDLLRSGAEVRERRAELADAGTDLGSIARTAAGLTVHEAGFRAAAAPAAVPAAPLAPAEDEAPALFMCQMCGFIYEPEEGDELGGIASGTRFADLPAEWTCPVCGAQKTDFETVEG